MDLAADQATIAAETSWGEISDSAPGVYESIGPGSVVGGRYEIVRILGEGGMGAVYEARDREVDRTVAFKIIRPDLANNPEILRMFKQELVLARQVTHRNVVRIYDLGSANGLRFITMQFVEGTDLKSIIREKGKLSPEEAAKIAVQVCEGLEAAHKENVVHRDLKPQNIMVDSEGRAYVMDFGLAHSTASGGTKGHLLGTPDYMSPEQAKREDVDARSDIFTVGLILQEMLTGQVPLAGNNLHDTLQNRITASAAAPIGKEAGIPKRLCEIVSRCLAFPQAERYQSVAELTHDLQVWRGVIVPSNTKLWKWITIASGAAALGVLGFSTVMLNRKPPAPIKPVTALIADFRNNTGDAVFSGTVESTLKLALEGASFISAYDRTRMRDLGLRGVAGPLDEAKAMQIAASQGLNVVISGDLDQRGNGYRLSLRAVQPITGKVLAKSSKTASGKDQVLLAVSKLGIAVREALGDATSESAQRLSMETITASSIDAVHSYAAGLDALSAGKFEDSLKNLNSAVALDPNFGMAYTVMASAARNLGRQQEAENYIQEALKHIDRMTERERYRTRGYHYLLKGDNHKCVDEYSALLQRYPADSGAYTNIGLCRLHLHEVARALEDARQAVAILPKRAIYRGNLAMDLAFNGDDRGAAKEAQEALNLGYTNSYLHLAYAALLQEQPAGAAEAYRKFAQVNASDAATGLADLAVYEGRYADAVKIFESGAAADLAAPKPLPDDAATKFWGLANAHLSRGQKHAALAAVRRALELSKTAQTRFVAAQIFVTAGDLAAAREISAGLASELQIEPQTYAKLLDGEIALQEFDGRAAVKLFTEANKLLDTWTGRYDLGRAYLEIGAFPEADSEFDRCIKRRGEALALFLNLPTYGYFPPVYYYQGRAREGMKSSGYKDSYRNYLSIRGKAAEDPLLSDIKHRLKQ